MDAFYGEGTGELLLIPVPLTQKRVSERGYNQAVLLAEKLEELLQQKGYRVELRLDILEKTRETAQQKHMGATSRNLNVAGAYHIHDRKSCRGRTVVLVDDIMTTGATGSECADRLKRAGAKSVYLLTVASVPPVNGY